MRTRLTALVISATTLFVVALPSAAAIADVHAQPQGRLVR
jgi:hypothetical protein